jgi:hypothetical protein
MRFYDAYVNGNGNGNGIDEAANSIEVTGYKEVHNQNGRPQSAGRHYLLISIDIVLYIYIYKKEIEKEKPYSY